MVEAKDRGSPGPALPELCQQTLEVVGDTAGKIDSQEVWAGSSVLGRRFRGLTQHRSCMQEAGF